LESFWNEKPIKLTDDDDLFTRVLWFWEDKEPSVDLTNIRDIRQKARIDFAHARNALTYGGSDRMQTYGSAYSTLKRHIGSEKNDIVISVTHMAPRSRKFRHAYVYWKVKPTFDHLSGPFKVNAKDLYNTEQSGNANQKDERFGNFIRRFGTHYVQHGVMGGEYGADFYYSGYGIKPEMAAALIDVRNADLYTSFEYHRLRTFTEALGGHSFIRNLDGTAEFGPDIKGFSYGGNPYGIRASSGDSHWRGSIENNANMAVIIEHKELTSIAELLGVYGASTRQGNLAGRVMNTFKKKVVSNAHYWLVLHYWCFFLDNSCENKRRHPFLREDTGDALCSNTHNRRLRARTEIEVCLGQESRDSGAVLRSTTFPYGPTKWCKGKVIDANNPEQIPSNYPPYTLTRRGNCPLTPPVPHWPSAYSFCLTKPVGQKSCPIEQFPEFEWTWDWEQEMQDTFHTHALDHNALEETYETNAKRDDPATNVNPINRVYSCYPWSYDFHDFFPRDNPWEEHLEETKEAIEENLQVRLRTRKKTESHIALGLPFPPPPSVAAIQAYEAGILQDLNDWYTEETKNHYGIWLKNYKGSNIGTNPHYELNQVYHLHIANFIDFNGWQFWDTEDTNPNNDYMGPVLSKRTPTHMDVARLYKYDYDWSMVGANRRGGKQMHAGSEAWEELLYLWPEPNADNYKTGGIRMEYCCTGISSEQEHKAEHNLHWPDGHLCIYGHGAVDSTNYKFRQGTVGWDCENGERDWPKEFGNQIYLDPANEVFKLMDDLSSQQRLVEALPTGLYHVQFDGTSEQYYVQNLLCMKEDKSLEKRIILPRDEPFYLMQYQGLCQKVWGMFDTPVELKWATEVDHKSVWAETGLFDRMFIELEMNSWGHVLAYGRRDTLPDGHYGQDYISIWYCFYQKIVKREPSLNYDPLSMDRNGVYSHQYGDVLNPLCP